MQRTIMLGLVVAAAFPAMASAALPSANWKQKECTGVTVVEASTCADVTGFVKSTEGGGYIFGPEVCYHLQSFP